ncbi:MAG: discoidin domain-containing protein, partial [Clostridia bacterium]|nr:discoidin domain-containing protein [Clostridia bacterium]
LDTVLLYGIESDEAANELPRKYVDSTTVAVTYVGTSTTRHEEDGTADQIWDTTDKTTKYTAQENAAAGLYYVSGSFAKATVITKIVYYSPATHANRVRGSYFEASVNGTDWVKIATLPGYEAPYANSGTVELTIDDDTAYRYIRLVQQPSFYSYYWSVGTVEVIGLASEN